MCCIDEPATYKVQLHICIATSLLFHLVDVSTHACSLPACSAEVLGSDGSIRPCAVKTVSYSNWLEQDQVHRELTVLKAALGLPHLVQWLGVLKSQRLDGKMTLTVATK